MTKLTLSGVSSQGQQIVIDLPEWIAQTVRFEPGSTVNLLQLQALIDIGEKALGCTQSMDEEALLAAIYDSSKAQEAVYRPKNLGN